MQVDKGFEYSAIDGAWVYYRKNHFQMSTSFKIDAPEQSAKDARLGFIKLGSSDELVPIEGFNVQVKATLQESEHEVEVFQASSDRDNRKKRRLEPFEMPTSNPTFIVLERLHISNATRNNGRVDNLPNPFQKYFVLRVAFYAVAAGKNHCIRSFVSPSLIVRGGNPGRFESKPASPSKISSTMASPTLGSPGMATVPSLTTPTSPASASASNQYHRMAQSSMTSIFSDDRLGKKLDFKRKSDHLDQRYPRQVHASATMEDDAEAKVPQSPKSHRYLSIVTQAAKRLKFSSGTEGLSPAEDSETLRRYCCILESMAALDYDVHERKRIDLVFPRLC